MVLDLPEGLEYVAGSFTVNETAATELGWSGGNIIEWTESTLMVNGYCLSAVFDEYTAGTPVVLGTFTVTATELAEYTATVTNGEFTDTDYNIITYGVAAESVSYVSAYPVDTTELEAAITEAEGIDTSLYTEDSVAALEEALAAAQAVLADADATQDEIDAATAALEAAIAGLVEVSSTTEATEATAAEEETTTTTAADEEETTTTAADEEETTTASDDDDTTTTAAADDSSSSSSSSSTSSDSTPNTGAQAAVGLSIFMAAGLAGVVAIKKRRK